MAPAEVGCELAFEVADHATLACQVAPATGAGVIEEETLVVELDGRTVAVDELAVAHGGRVHRVSCGPGLLALRYHAVLQPRPAEPEAVDDVAALVGLRQSRYCPSDAVEAYARRELGALGDGDGLGHEVAAWVHDRLSYELGSSGPLDTAVDTLLAGRGVCRDFAHLTIMLCRALGLPARLAAVYAPGLSPMDFHAVAEVACGGRWEVVDATRLAPRQSLVRIATGRDAADTSFATTVAGSVTFLRSEIVALTHADLPLDDHRSPVLLA